MPAITSFPTQPTFHSFHPASPPSHHHLFKRMPKIWSTIPPIFIIHHHLSNCLILTASLFISVLSLSSPPTPLPSCACSLNALLPLQFQSRFHLQFQSLLISISLATLIASYPPCLLLQLSLFCFLTSNLASSSPCDLVRAHLPTLSQFTSTFALPSLLFHLSTLLGCFSSPPRLQSRRCLSSITSSTFRNLPCFKIHPSISLLLSN